MNSHNLENIEKNKDHNEIKNFVVGLLLRTVATFTWFYIYVSFIWFLGYQGGFVKALGFSALIIGFLTIITPQKIFGARKWRGSIAIFFMLSLLLIFLM